MATLKPELKAILDECGIDPRDKSQIWDCHGTLVLYHKAYEIIAAKRNIVFDPPTIIEASSESKIVAILVVGRWKERVEWSIGEAAPGNNKNAYPYAMAEKRAKDRVIAKLVGLAAHVYSEDEADEFKTGERKAVEIDSGTAQAAPKAAAPATNGAKAPPPDMVEAAERIVKAIKAAAHIDALDAFMDSTMDERNGFPPPTRQHFDKVYTAKRQAMESVA